MRVLLALVAAAVWAPASALAEPTFDDAAASATSIASVDTLVWSLAASCEGGDDLAQRQCRLTRDASAKALAGRTLLLQLEPGTFEVGPWDGNKKSTPLTLRGCLDCNGVIVDGKRWLVTAARPGKVAAGKTGGVLHQTARTFRDDAAAVAWATTVVPRLVAQALVRLPAGRPTGGTLALELVGYRVYDPCDGLIVLAEPSAATVAKDPKACGPVPGGDAAVAELTPTMLQAALAPAKAAAVACHERFGVDGKATMKLVIGGDGAIVALEQQGDFVDTPTGACLEAAVRDVRFPRSNKRETKVSYPLVLR